MTDGLPKDLFPQSFKPPPQTTESEEVASAETLEERIGMSKGRDEYIAKLDGIRLPVTRPLAPVPKELLKPPPTPIPWGGVLWIVTMMVLIVVSAHCP